MRHSSFRFRHHLHANPTETGQWAMIFATQAPTFARVITGSFQIQNLGAGDVEISMAGALDVQYANFFGAGGTPEESTWVDYGSPFTVVGHGGTVTKSISVNAAQLAMTITPGSGLCHLVLDGWFDTPVHINQNNVGDRNHYAMVVNGTAGTGGGGGGGGGSGVEVVEWPLSPLLSDTRGEIGAESYDPVNAILYKKVDTDPHTWWMVNAATE